MDRQRPMPSYWIKKEMWSEGIGMGEDYGYWYECANCGHRTRGGHLECGDNFCSHCGADMRKEQQ